MFKVIILFVFFSSYTFGSYHQVFGPIIEQCNRTFFISRDMLYMEDVEKFFNMMKVDRNGKCFVHCFLQKIDLVDPKGEIRKIGFFDSIKNTIQKLPDEVKSYNLTSELQKVTMSFIEKCEDSDPVKQEGDPCEKLFKFFLCFKDLKCDEILESLL